MGRTRQPWAPRSTITKPGSAQTPAAFVGAEVPTGHRSQYERAELSSASALSCPDIRRSQVTHCIENARANGRAAEPAWQDKSRMSESGSSLPLAPGPLRPVRVLFLRISRGIRPSSGESLVDLPPKAPRRSFLKALKPRRGKPQAPPETLPEEAPLSPSRLSQPSPLQPIYALTLPPDSPYHAKEDSVWEQLQDHNRDPSCSQLPGKSSDFPNTSTQLTPPTLDFFQLSSSSLCQTSPKLTQSPKDPPVPKQALPHQLSHSSQYTGQSHTLCPNNLYSTLPSTHQLYSPNTTKHEQHSQYPLSQASVSLSPSGHSHFPNHYSQQQQQEQQQQGKSGSNNSKENEQPQRQESHEKVTPSQPFILSSHLPHTYSQPTLAGTSDSSSSSSSSTHQSQLTDQPNQATGQPSTPGALQVASATVTHAREDHLNPLALKEACEEGVLLRGRLGLLARVRKAAALVVSQLRRTGQMLASKLGPQGPGDNDTGAVEKGLNVITCGPFFLVGTSVLRECKSELARRFGKMFCIIGCVASAYHTSYGPIRPLMRKADYWTIAYSSMVLRQAVFSRTTQVPATSSLTCNSSTARGVVVQEGHFSRRASWPCLEKALDATCFAMIPFKPSIVSSLSFALVEGRCAWLAVRGPKKLLHNWLKHLGSGAIATACFKLDGYPCIVRLFPFLHAVWHCMAAVGMVTITPMLIHVELSA